MSDWEKRIVIAQRIANATLVNDGFLLRGFIVHAYLASIALLRGTQDVEQFVEIADLFGEEVA